jgi:hypothetical protein
MEKVFDRRRLRRFGRPQAQINFDLDRCEVLHRLDVEKMGLTAGRPIHLGL